MTKGFCKTGTAFLLASTVFFAAGDSLAQSCAVAPTCESLGYTMAAADCSGKKTLKCPFDKNKLYCVTEAGLANVNLGDIFFSDHTTSTPSIFVNKTPIGIVVGKTADSVIIAHLAQKVGSFGTIDFKAVGLEVNKNNSGIDAVDFWEPDQDPFYRNIYPSPLTFANEIKEIINSNDNKTAYQLLINKLFSGNIFSNTLDELGFTSGENPKGCSICDTSESCLYRCPEVIAPKEVSVKWQLQISDLDEDVFTYCSKMQTEGTSVGDWYLPSKKDLEEINQGVTSFNNTYKDVWNAKLPEGFCLRNKCLPTALNYVENIQCNYKSNVYNSENIPVRLYYSQNGTAGTISNSQYFTYQVPSIQCDIDKLVSDFICIAKIKM